MSAKHATMPYTEDGEKGVLCSLLLSPIAVAETLSARGVSETEFYLPCNQHVFSAVQGLIAKRKPVDFVSVRACLKSAGQLDDSGGKEYLDELYSFVPTAANADYYALMVKDRAQARETIQAAQSIIALAQDDGNEFAVVRDQVEQLLTRVARSNDALKGEESFEETVSAWYDDLSCRAERIDKTGFLFGIPTLDEQLGAAQPGEQVLVMAPPSVGKSALVAQGVFEAAQRGLHSMIFSLEMTNFQLLDRAFARRARANMSGFRRGTFTGQECSRLAEERDRVKKLPMHLGRSIDLGGICGELRKAKVKHDIRVAAVDYPQMVKVLMQRRNANREEIVADISSTLKGVAKELGIVMVLPLPVNKQGEARESERLTYDADIAVKLRSDPDGADVCRDLMCWIEKNRQGPRYFSVPVAFDGAYMSFYDRPKPAPPPPAQVNGARPANVTQGYFPAA